MTLSTDTERELEAFVDDWLADSDVPGAAVALVDPEGIRYAAGFGARDLETNEPATPDTLFGVGSISKSFAALAVMQLVEAGVVSLDDPVDQYVDHYEGVPGEPIAVADLLSHTSGMPSDGSGVVLISRKMGLDPKAVPMSSDDDFERHVRAAADDRVTDRDAFFYYNGGYTVLGRVVEAVTDETFAEYVAGNVLEPLGMERSTYDPEAFRGTEDRLTPYFPEDGEPTPREFPFDHIKHAPGGLVSSVAEMATYLRMQMRGGEVDGTRLASEKSVAKMHDRHATRTRTIDGDEEHYGYGWMIRDFLDDTLVGHGGSVAVSTAYAGFLRQAELGVVVLCNTSAAPHPMHVGPALLAIVEGEDPSQVEQAFALERKLEPLEGEYASHRDVMEATVERTGGTLSLTLSAGLGEQTLSLVPTSLDPDAKEFEAVTGEGNREPVRFEETGDGYDLFVQRWRLHPK